MKKLLLCAVLATGIGGASFLDSSAIAQATKKADTKKVEPSAKPGKIEIKEGKDHKYRFIVHDSDGDFLCTSAAFKTEKDAMEGIDDLKAVLANTKPTIAKGTHDQDEKIERKDTKKKMDDKSK